MKKILLILTLSQILCFVALAQTQIKESNLPNIVKSKFNSSFPNSTNVRWIKDNSDYTATFVFDKRNSTASYTETGRMIFTEVECGISDCPRAMKKYLSTNFGEQKIVKIFLKEERDISSYTVEIIDESYKEKIFAEFDSAGAFVNKISEKEKKEIQKAEKGKLVVHPRELPSAISSYLLSNYPEHDIAESYIINNEKNSNTYMVVVNNEKNNKIKLFFDYQGVLLSATDISTSKSDMEPSKDTTKENKKEKRKYGSEPFPQNKVPQIAVDYFAKKAPRAEGMRWDTIKSSYVATYTDPVRRNENKMYFDKKGNFVMSVVVLDKKSLLPSIEKYLYENYPNLEIASAENQNRADKSKFTLVRIFSNSWINVPMVFHEIYFSTSGRVEKEVLANYIDGDEAAKKKAKAERQAAFQEYIDKDDIALDNDDNSIEGQKVSRKDLPTMAAKYLDKNFAEWTYVEGVTATEDGTLIYNIIMRKSGQRDRKRIVFDLYGNFLKQEDI